MMSGFIGVVILVEPAKPGVLIIGKIVQEEERKWSHYYAIYIQYCTLAVIYTSLHVQLGY